MALQTPGSLSNILEGTAKSNQPSGGAYSGAVLVSPASNTPQLISKSMNVAPASTTTGKNAISGSGTSGSPTSSNTSGASAASQAASAAAAAQASQIANILNSVNDQIGSVKSSGTTGFGSLIASLKNQGDDAYNNLTGAQNNINQQRQQVQLGSQQSLASLLNTLHQQAQSGSAQLSGGNSLSSSAAGSIARILSQYGNQQRTSLGQQTAQQLNTVDQSQNSLNLQKQSTLDDMNNSAQAQAQSIANDVGNQLRQIDQYANQMGQAGKVDINGTKDSIVNAGMAQLAQLQQQLGGRVSGIQGISNDQAAQQAYQLLQQGATTAGNNLQYTTYDPQAALTGSSVNGQGQTQDGAATTLLPFYLRNQQF